MTFDALQKKVGEAYAALSPHSADLIHLAKDFSALEGEVPGYVRMVRAAFLGSYTLQGLSDVCKTRALFHNIWMDTFDAGYNQFSQAVFGENGAFYEFNPTIVYCLLDAPELLDADHLSSVVETVLERTGAYIVISNFVVSPKANAEKVAALNTRLAELGKNTRVIIFDLAQFLDDTGIERVWYTKYVALGDLRIAPDFFPQLAERLLQSAVALSGATKKCLVVDLDNTMWKGVIGEDGLTHIEHNIDFQKRLLELYNHGVILTISSKNNIEDALPALEADSPSVIKKDHFAAWRISWQSKDQSVIEIAEELNIGTDSMVFVDDSPFEQSLVRMHVPEVAVLHPDHLASYAGFSARVLTEEDTRRGAMYVEERKRKEMRTTFRDETDFLKSLGLRVSITHMTPEELDRVSQLSQKTNQYNLTTRRRTREEVTKLIEEGMEVAVLDVRDNVGEYGLTGVCMFTIEDKKLVLDNFFISCRVIGRGVERALVGYLRTLTERAGATEIVGTFIPTKKNQIGRDFYTKNGFELVEEKGGVETWRLPLSLPYTDPEYITITTDL